MEIEFKNGKTYELEDAGRDGILVFKDAIFRAPFDKDGVTNFWGNCSLKKRLESWWNENAPDALKEKYDVSILSIEEVFDQEEIDRFFYRTRNKPSKSNRLPLFMKDWKARIKRLPDGKTSSYWWLRSPHHCYILSAPVVGTSGTLYDHTNYNRNGCVPVCYPKGYLSSSLEPSAFSDGGK